MLLNAYIACFLVGVCVTDSPFLSYRLVLSLSAICRTSPTSLQLTWDQCVSVTICGTSFCGAVGLKRARPLRKLPAPVKTGWLRLPNRHSAAVRRSLFLLMCSHTHWVSRMSPHTHPRRHPPRPPSLLWRLKKRQRRREGKRSKVRGYQKDEGELIDVTSTVAGRCTPRALTWKRINGHTPVSSFYVRVYNPTCILTHCCHNSFLSFGKQSFSHSDRAECHSDKSAIQSIF